MSDELSDFFAAPPFKADEALIKLRRDLRELKPLVDKGEGAVWTFAWRSLPVIQLQAAPVRGADGQPALQVAVAKRPSQRPEWQTQTLASSAAVRKWLEQLKLSLKRWDDED